MTLTQPQRAQRAKETIYQAALIEFGNHGYDGVNMEAICNRHKISKGMMYHYVKGKDDLFLLCVERTFDHLKTHIEQQIMILPQDDVVHTIREFFMIRQSYFQANPLEKKIFETAMLQSPPHLKERIHALHQPLRTLNHLFLNQQIAKLPLRSELDHTNVMRFLECMTQLFPTVLYMYLSDDTTNTDMIFTKTDQLIDMFLFGLIDQSKR